MFSACCIHAEIVGLIQIKHIEVICIYYMKVNVIYFSRLTAFFSFFFEVTNI